jgi:hypothetical protein
MVIVVIFTAMFTTSLVMYAMNGQSLDEKIVGINRYSTDRLWLETENTVPVGNLMALMNIVRLIRNFYL